MEIPWRSSPVAIQPEKCSATLVIPNRPIPKAVLIGMLVCYLTDGERVYETYWTSGRATEVMAPSYGLLDMTVYGR